VSAEVDRGPGGHDILEQAEASMTSVLTAGATSWMIPAVLRRRAILLLTASLPLWLVSLGPCGHCYAATPQPSCHHDEGRSGHGDDASHHPVPAPASSNCHCATHHLCAMPRVAQTLSRATQSKLVTPDGPLGRTSVIVARPSAQERLHRIRERGSPAPARTPLYLSCQSLLI
jgi:hypothetical protein